MAFHYFKIPPHLAVKFGIANIKEKRLPDGNYMAICQDMGLLHHVAMAKAASMGCLPLTPSQIQEEFRGEQKRPLPQPTDPKYFPDENFDPLTGDFINGIVEDSQSEEPSNDEPNEELQSVEIVIENHTEEEEREPDMVFEDEDGEPIINVYFPDNEEDSEEINEEEINEEEINEEEEPKEEGGE